MTDEIDLSGSWTLMETGGAAEVHCPLPGDAITALAAAGVIPEPYGGRNEYDCRWVAERDWEMRRTFDAVPGAGWVLEADGLDTVAEVAVNGETVLKADNAFRRWRVRLPDGLVRETGNEVAIRFPSALAEANRRQAAQPFPVPYHEENCPLPNGNMLRKPQCDFGWTGTSRSRRSGSGTGSGWCTRPSPCPAPSRCGRSTSRGA